MNSMRGIASIDRLSRRISPKYRGYWQRRENARKTAEFMRPMWDAMAKEMASLDRKFADFSAPDFSIPGAKIGDTLNIRKPVRLA